MLWAAVGLIGATFHVGCQSKARERRGDATAPTSAAPTAAPIASVSERAILIQAKQPNDASVDADTVELTVPSRDLEVHDTIVGRDVATICRAFVTRVKKAPAPPHLRPGPPSCRAAPLPVSFVANGTFRSAHAIAYDSGVQQWTQLVVEVNRRLVHPPIVWDYFDPDGALTADHPGTFEDLRVEDTRLVATVGREEGWTSPAFKPTPGRDTDRDIDFMELRLVRSVIVCEASSKGALACRGYFPGATRPVLGMKRRPWPPTWPPDSPWSSLPWDRPTPSFRITSEGLVVSR